MAEAPTVAVSALASARTEASKRITRVRSLPPRAEVSAREPARPSLPAARAVTPAARRPGPTSSVIGASPADAGCPGKSSRSRDRRRRPRSRGASPQLQLLKLLLGAKLRQAKGDEDFEHVAFSSA